MGTLGDVKKELPVMVYIHGGAFRVGGGHVNALHGEFLGFSLLGIVRCLGLRLIGVGRNDEVGGVEYQGRTSCYYS